jgi:hypothetical protein
LELHLELLVGDILLSYAVGFSNFLGGDGREYYGGFYEVMLEFDVFPLGSCVGLPSFDPSASREFMSSSLNNHIRDSLRGMALIEIRPFLHLPFEVISVDFLDTNRGWMYSIKRKWSHNNDWIIENTGNINREPGVCIRLVLDKGAHFHNCFSFDLWLL